MSRQWRFWCPVRSNTMPTSSISLNKSVAGKGWCIAHLPNAIVPIGQTSRHWSQHRPSANGVLDRQMREHSHPLTAVVRPRVRRRLLLAPCFVSANHHKNYCDEQLCIQRSQSHGADTYCAATRSELTVTGSGVHQLQPLTMPIPLSM